MLQAEDASSVEYRNLSRVDQKTFDGACNREMQGLLDLGANRLMSFAESLAFRRDHPDNVLPSRWVERWKGTDEGTVKAKGRVVILSFKDPHVLQLER
eukprot:11969156-Karenia_brevis.AAC.1